MDGITNPPIDELLDKSGSKYSLVLYAAKRARQINAYYSQLGEGLLEYVELLLVFILLARQRGRRSPVGLSQQQYGNESMKFATCTWLR